MTPELQNLLVLIAARTAVAAMFAKPAVDILRTQFPMAGWLPPTANTVIAFLIALLFSVALNEPITGSLIATCILTGLASAAGGVALTELQKKVPETPK